MRAGMLKVRGLYLYKASPGDAPLALRVENLNREWVGFWPSGACAGPVGRLDGEFSGPLRMGDAETLQRVREVLGERPALSAPGKVPPGWVSDPDWLDWVPRYWAEPSQEPARLEGLR